MAENLGEALVEIHVEEILFNDRHKAITALLAMWNLTPDDQKSIVYLLHGKVLDDLQWELEGG